MEIFNDLRRLYQNFQKRRRARKNFVVQWQDGLPDGLETGTLNTICKDFFQKNLSSVRYQHLSGWKSTGAYRLMVTTQAGTTLRLIYKNSIYSQDQIPALVNLPILPGLPEYVIYSQPAGALQDYLPTVYRIEELERGTHYRYFLEDLSENYFRAYTYEDILACAGLLPGFHQAFDDWAASSTTAGLLQYGRSLSLSLQAYAHASLENFSQYSDDPTLKTILKRWPEIAELHADPVFFKLQADLPIHGDTNFTNLHLSKTDRQRIKLVDWEWAGFGLPYADLASLLKGTPAYIERNAFQRFTGRNTAPNPCLDPNLSEAEKMRLYCWCQLERGILDAGFLAAQSSNSGHIPAFSLPQAVSQALARVLSTYQRLTN